MARADHDIMGAVLAGGAGRRLGGDKALVLLGGRPLIIYPVAVMRDVVADVAIVAKPDTALPADAPELAGVRVLREPPHPRHPLVGIVRALEAAGDRSVLICAGDLPFIDAAVLEELAAADPGAAPAVIATDPQGALQPLLGLYRPQARTLLAPAAQEGRASVRGVVEALSPRRVTVAAEALFNVNSSEDLARASARLGVSRR